MRRSLVLLLPLALMAWVPRADATVFLMRGYVIGTGATPSAGSINGTTVMLGTAGQSVVGISNNGFNSLRHGFWAFGGSRVVAVMDPPVGSDLPRELAFGRPTPNPSPGGVRFELALPKRAQVCLAIYDIGGREVHRFDSGEIAAGYHTLSWDGANARGETTGSGVYFAQLLVDGRLTASRRFTRMR